MKRPRTELDQSYEEVRIQSECNTDSPRTSIQRRISFVDDTDEEVLINNQAHKKRKMSQEVQELKVWFGQAIAGLSTRDQSDTIIANINAHAAQIAENKMTGYKNSRDIQEIKNSLSSIDERLSKEGDAASNQTKNNNRLPGLYSTAAAATPHVGAGVSAVATRNLPSDEDYEFSRRTILIWPIEGDTEETLRENF